MNGIRNEPTYITVPGAGQAIAWLPVIPEDAPYRVREGAARQRIAAATGTCPCGAETNYTAAVEHGLKLAEVLHDRRCPGDPTRLRKALRRWAR